MPKFDSYGTLKGLAYQHDFGSAMNNVMKAKEYANRRELQKQQKAQYLAEKVQRGYASTEYNSKRLQSYYDKLNKDLGEFLVENPDWETDVMKVNQFNEITDKYLNNNILREDIEVQKEREMFLSDMSNISRDHFINTSEQYQQYANQEFDPDNPDQESQERFRYMPEAKVSFSDVLKKYTPSTETTGGEYSQSTIPNPDSVDAKLALLIGDTQDSDLARKSYNDYLKAMKENEVDPLYRDFEDYARAMIKSSVDIAKDDYRRMKKNNDPDGNGGGLGWMPRTISVLESLYTDGMYGGGDALLNFTPFQETGRSFNLANIDGVFLADVGKNSRNNINKIPGMDGLLANSEAMNASEIKYFPETGDYKVKTKIMTALPVNESLSEEDREKDLASRMEELSKYGFSEVDPSVSTLGYTIKQFDDNKYYVSTDVWVPADMGNVNNRLRYEQSYSKRGDVDKSMVQFDDKITQGFKEFKSQSDFIYDYVQERAEEYKNKFGGQPPENTIKAYQQQAIKAYQGESTQEKESSSAPNESLTEGGPLGLKLNN